MSTSTEPSEAIPAARVDRAVDLLLARVGTQIRDERRRRRWTMAVLAQRVGCSRPSVAALERGQRVSLDLIVGTTMALGLELSDELLDMHRRSGRPKPDEDPVHAAMGELEASHLGDLGYPVGVDEPYQHYQFAGRADVVAWRLEPAGLLHIENRTRFPNVGEVAGSWNAKRQWLGPELAQRLGIKGFASETHVMACLWSSEVLHAMRLRPATFRALAPHPADAFRAWWDGRPPAHGRTSQLIVIDPFATGRQRLFVDLATALGDLRPRLRGYAEAAERLHR